MNENYAGTQDCQDFFCQTIPFDLRKNRRLHCFHSYPYKRALGMRLTRPALKSSKVSGNGQRGFQEGHWPRCPASAAAASSVPLLWILHVFTSMTFVAFCLQQPATPQMGFCVGV